MPAPPDDSAAVSGWPAKIADPTTAPPPRHAQGRLPAEPLGGQEEPRQQVNRSQRRLEPADDRRAEHVDQRGYSAGPARMRSPRASRYVPKPAVSSFSAADPPERDLEGGEQREPRERIEERRLDVSQQRRARVAGGVPQRRLPALELVAGELGQRVVLDGDVEVGVAPARLEARGLRRLPWRIVEQQIAVAHLAPGEQRRKIRKRRESQDECRDHAVIPQFPAHRASLSTGYAGPPG